MNIPTTRSLAVVKTGEDVLRETLQQGAVLTRIASSHLRVGTFQYIASKQDITTLKIYCNNHYHHVRILIHHSNTHLTLTKKRI